MCVRMVGGHTGMEYFLLASATLGTALLTLLPYTTVLCHVHLLHVPVLAPLTAYHADRPQKQLSDLIHLL